jgi:hypothetical protein
MAVKHHFTCNVVIVGDYRVGRTTLLIKHINRTSFSPIAPFERHEVHRSTEPVCYISTTHMVHVCFSLNCSSLIRLMKNHRLSGFESRESTPSYLDDDASILNEAKTEALDTET